MKTTQTKLTQLEKNILEFKKLLSFLIIDKIHHLLRLALGSRIGFNEQVPPQIIANIKRLSEIWVKCSDAFSFDEADRIRRLKGRLDSVNYGNTNSILTVLVSTSFQKAQQAYITSLKDLQEKLIAQENFLRFFTPDLQLPEQVNIEIQAQNPNVIFLQMIMQMMTLKKEHPSLISGFDNIVKVIFANSARLIDFSSVNPEHPVYCLMYNSYLYLFPTAENITIAPEMLRVCANAKYREVKDFDLEELFKSTAEQIEKFDKGLASRAAQFLGYYKFLELYGGNPTSSKKMNLVENLYKRLQIVTHSTDYYQYFLYELHLEMSERKAAIAVKRSAPEDPPVSQTKVADVSKKPKKNPKNSQKESKNSAAITPKAIAPAVALSAEDINSGTEPPPIRKFNPDAKPFVPSYKLQDQRAVVDAVQTQVYAVPTQKKVTLARSKHSNGSYQQNTMAPLPTSYPTVPFYPYPSYQELPPHLHYQSAQPTYVDYNHPVFQAPYVNYQPLYNDYDPNFGPPAAHAYHQSLNNGYNRNFSPPPANGYNSFGI